MPENDVYVPVAGDPLGFEDLELISSAVLRRQENFPDEPIGMTVALVLANIGDRFALVKCINGEWEGVKANLTPTGKVPKCPNGHVMTQGEGLRLGWLAPPTALLPPEITN